MVADSGPASLLRAVYGARSERRKTATWIRWPSGAGGAAARARADPGSAAAEGGRHRADDRETAAGLQSALDAEAWASHLLGSFHQQRQGLPFPDAAEVDAALVFGEPLVLRLASFADPAARVALASIAELDDGELGVLAAQLLSGAAPVLGVPEWIEQIGESEVVGAAVMSDAVFDDARTVLLESRHPDGEGSRSPCRSTATSASWPRTSCCAWPCRQVHVSGGDGPSGPRGADLDAAPDRRLAGRQSRASGR